MSISTTTYVRKPIYVDAVQVTEENFEALAEWCKGKICETMSVRNRPLKYIHVPVTNPQTERQEQARVGDWILMSERGYKVYTPNAFMGAFDMVNKVPAKSYPFPDGDVTVLGPEVFAESNSGSPADTTVISWKGENFYKQTTAAVDTDAAITVLKDMGWTINGDEFIPPPETQEDIVAQRRALESEIRNEAVTGKITSEEAEMKIRHLPDIPVQPVGTQPMPDQPMPDVDPASVPPVDDTPEVALDKPKAAEVWARVERGELSDDEARVLLGVQKIVENDPTLLPEYLCNQCKRPKRRDNVGEFCVECGGMIVARDDVISQQAVGTQPMPPQTEHTDVEVRERPVSLPPNVTTARDILTEQTAVDPNGEIQHMDDENDPNDPATHVGVDLEQDEAQKASVDLTDEDAIKAADLDEALTADAMTEE